MSAEIDLPALRGLGTPREVALFLRDVSTRIQTLALTTYLLEATEREALAPDVFCIWLSASNDTRTILRGVEQKFSDLIRHAAIADFGRLLRTGRWREAWTGFGGVTGINQILGTLSYDEVGQMCRVIGRSGNIRKSDHDAQRLEVTRLVKSLLPQVYPDSKHKTQDQRPLRRHYATLVSSCTGEYVREVLMRNGRPFQDFRHLPQSLIAQYHWPTVRQIMLDLINEKDEIEEDWIDTNSNLLDAHLSLLLHQIPQLPTRERGFSASMQFSLSVLQAVVEKKEVDLERVSVIPDLVDPLVRRLRKYGVAKQTSRQVVDVALSFLQNHPNDVESDSLTGDTFPSFLINCWCEDPGTFQSRLVSYLAMHKGQGSLTFGHIEKYVLNAPQESRYDLLRLIFMHHKQYEVDIETEEGLKHLSIKQWRSGFIKALPVENAIQLLQRLLKVRPECDFLESQARHWRESSIFNHGLIESGGLPDPMTLLIHLGRDDGAISQKAKEAIREVEDKAMKSRDASERALHIESAFVYAIATGSLEVYEEVILWSKRFLRDSFVIKKIFHRSIVATVEGVALLSGIDLSSRPEIMYEVQESIHKGNNILMRFLEFALIALKEQSFSRSDWSHLLDLFGKVVHARVENLSVIQKSMDFSSTKAYEIVWKPTIEMLLEAEKLGLEPGHEALDFDSPFGAIGNHYTRITVRGKPCPSVHRFLDDLARERDALWRLFRPTIYPAVASLGPPWPTGLAIQHFSLLETESDDANSPLCPFLSSRAKAVLFMKQNPVIHESSLDEDTLEAIGIFVDNYETALAFHIRNGFSKQDRETGARMALEHVLNLSLSRMSRLEALAFWRPVYNRALPDITCPQFQEVINYGRGATHPVLPQTQDPQERDEWNPLEWKPEEIKRRDLPTTLLDCTLNVSQTSMWRGSRPLTLPKSCTVSLTPSDFWAMGRLHMSEVKKYHLEDAMIIAALLFLDTRMSGPPSVLTYAYPSDRDARFCPLFLDQKFLDATREHKNRSALDILELFIRRIPPRMLQPLTAKALHNLASLPTGSPDASTLQHTAFGLLHLLTQSDRPDLACGFILDILINDPEASAWHRFLLTKDLMQRLRASTVETLVNAFVEGIGTKLHEQSLDQKATAGKEGRPDSSLPTQLVKVTTVKFVAQLLQNVNVVPVTKIVSWLVKIFQSSSHIDVRVATVESLLSRLSEREDDESAQMNKEIIFVLEKVVPVMGSLNERRPTTEEDWQRCEQAGQLPEVYVEGAVQGLQPIMASIYSARAEDRVLSDGTRGTLLHRVFFPAIQNSLQNNARWMKLFQRTYLPESSSHPFPAFPFKPIILSMLLNDHSSFISRKVLDLFQTFILTNMNPPAQIVELINSINGDMSLRNSDAGKHFLNQYGHGALAFQQNHSVLSNSLKHDWKESTLPSDEAITIEQVQHCLVKQAETLILYPRPPDPHFRVWETFIYQFQPPLTATYLYPSARNWINQVKPCLQQILSFLESVRREQVDEPALSSQDPPYLPDPYVAQLWTRLAFPHIYWTDKEHAHETYSAYAQSIIHQIRALISDGLKSHTHFENLKEELSRKSGSPVDRIAVAELLGDIAPPSSISSSSSSSLSPSSPKATTPSNTVIPRSSKKRSREETDTTMTDLDSEEPVSITVPKSASPDESLLRVKIANHLLDGISDHEEAVGGKKKDRLRALLRKWIASDVEGVRIVGWRRGKDEGVEL